jgi:hypothetical protein
VSKRAGFVRGNAECAQPGFTFFSGKKGLSTGPIIRGDSPLRGAIFDGVQDHGGQQSAYRIAAIFSVTGSAMFTDHFYAFSRI